MSFFDKFKKKKKVAETTPAKADQLQVPQENKMSLPKTEKETRAFAKVTSGNEVGQGKNKSPFDPSTNSGSPRVKSRGDKPMTGKKDKTANRQKKDTKDAYRILIRPLLTEKSSDLGIYNKYIFEVAPQANKTAIKKAMQSLYGKEPIAVNIINQSGKFTKYGRSSGYTKHWKKAIITLKAGDKIELYEGV